MATELPTELIERILLFASAADTVTCLNVSRVNKLGHRTATPYLYHKIDFSEHGMGRTAGDRVRKVAQLAATVLKSAQLARHVRALVMFLDEPRPELVVGDTPWTDPELMRELLTARRQENVHLWEVVEAWFAWQNNHLSYHVVDVNADVFRNVGVIGRAQKLYAEGAYLGLIMMACPNLKSLEFGGWYTTLRPVGMLYNALIAKLIPVDSEVALLSHNIARIEEIFFDDPENDVSISRYSVIEFILRWPSLRILAMRTLHLSDDMEFAREIRSSLQAMHVLDCFDNGQQWGLFLCCCPSLKLLNLTWSQHLDVYREADWRSLGEAMVEHTPYLEQLSLDITHVRYLRYHTLNWIENAGPEMSSVNISGLGSLARLRYLRKLYAPKIALFGVFDDVHRRDRVWTLADIIPDSLEELEIICEGIDFTEEDRSLLHAPGTARLKNLTIFNCKKNKWISNKDRIEMEDRNRNSEDEGSVRSMRSTYRTPPRRVASPTMEPEGGRVADD